MESIIIKIEKAESGQTKDKKPFKKLKDQNGHTYNIFKLKKDGTETKAWEFYKTLENDGIGQDVGISYNEDSYTYNGKQTTSRNIVIMHEPDGQPTVIQNKETPKEKEYVPIDDKPDWDKINSQKSDDISKMNAKNNACLIVANMLRTEKYDSLQIENDIKHFANFIYNLEVGKINSETEKDSLPF